MGNEARCQNEVGPLAERLVGYVDVAALCVACHALHFGFLAGPAALLAQFRNRWGSLSIVRLLLHLANCPPCWHKRRFRSTIVCDENELAVLESHPRSGQTPPQILCALD